MSHGQRSGQGRKSPSGFHGGNDCFQYVPDLQEEFPNIRTGPGTGHPTSSLRALADKVRDRAVTGRPLRPGVYLYCRNSRHFHNATAIPENACNLPYTTMLGFRGAVTAAAGISVLPDAIEPCSNSVVTSSECVPQIHIVQLDKLRVQTD